MRRAAGQLPVMLVLTALASGGAFGRDDEPAPVAALSPDQRPVLIVLPPIDELMLAHHAHRLSPSKAESLARELGLFLALPIIRSRARESVQPLPGPWRTDDRDRGFTEQLNAALDHSQANWPWRAINIVQSREEIDRLQSQLAGQDVAVAQFSYELEELAGHVQLNASADVTLVSGSGTPRESRLRTRIRHFAPSVSGDPRHAAAAAAEFHAGGRFDQLVSGAALDLSRALAVTVAHALTASPAPAAPARHFAELARKPTCAECRGSDPVLHEEPGRVWVAPAKTAGTILSLPVG